MVFIKTSFPPSQSPEALPYCSDETCALPEYLTLFHLSLDLNTQNR